jgi:dCTP deaminase
MPDLWIKQMSKNHKMIEPFAENRIRKGKISFGAGCYGYDFRLSNEFKVPDLNGQKLIDPKKMDALSFSDFQGRSCLIPPNSFVLARSLEYFRIPRDILVLCQGKSTYARCGVIVNVTPFEPEWEGYATISLVNSSPVAAKIYAREGIGQLIFLKAEEPCGKSYRDRKGKYQAPRSIQVSRV